MQHLDLQVIEQALAWSHADQRVWLCTVLATFGWSPREPGSLLVAREDGRCVGSQRTSAARVERLLLSGGLSQADVARLHMPIGDGRCGAGVSGLSARCAVTSFRRAII